MKFVCCLIITYLPTFNFLFEQGSGVNTGGLVIYPTQFWHAGEYKCVIQSSSDKVERKATVRVIGKYTLCHGNKYSKPWIMPKHKQYT